MLKVEASYRDLDKKLLNVSLLFRIWGDFLECETVQMGNVNKTYEVQFRLPGGKKNPSWSRT